MMDERAAQRALARYFDPYQQTVVPNCYFAGGEMDLLVVSRAGYLIEVEIKLSRADWKADAGKSKWTSAERRFVSRFYYAVPPELCPAAPPAWVPATAGILHLRDFPRVHLKAERQKAAPKLTDQQMVQILSSPYHRWWRSHPLGQAVA